MKTLGDILRILAQLGIRPHEIKIPRDIYMYIMRQAKALEFEEEDDEDESY